MQDQPLLEKLDWFFTSPAWTESYPNTVAYPLAKTTSDHTPCVINIQTSMPHSNIFRFENWWMEHENFLPMVELVWQNSIHYVDAAKIINAKFKILRKHLKTWAKSLSPIKEEILNVKNFVAFLDAIENFRDLTSIELTLREDLKVLLTSLLKKQKLYWQQRGKIKWVTLGSENSKKIHACATVQHRNNKIAQLTSHTGEVLQNHSEKASLLLESFKERLGISEHTAIPSAYLRLISPNHNLLILEDPFTEEEIDAVVAELPSNKSPGPDGFNTDFIKKCWSIIKKDFYELCSQFHSGNLCLQSINSSFIALIPKKDGAATVNDYRPISLLSCTIKLLTKLLANRLQKIKLFCSWYMSTNMVF